MCIVADSIRASPLFPGNITEHTTHPMAIEEGGKGWTNTPYSRLERGVSPPFVSRSARFLAKRNETKRNTVYVTENNPG